MTRIPSYLDRYPAKMVLSLADKIISKYDIKNGKLLDPFCGSSAILQSAKDYNNELIGMDLNPYALLLSEVKLKGFNGRKAEKICNKIIEKAKLDKKTLPCIWKTIEYWFTPKTLEKLLQLRHAIKKANLNSSMEGKAVILAFALSIRLCSKADQKSPKPFISKTAKSEREGIHFDPFKIIPDILNKLIQYYGDEKKEININLFFEDSSSEIFSKDLLQSISFIITSPPYINAQDYFRNFKIELYLLEDLLPFNIETIKNKFIGTERGDLLKRVSINDKELIKSLIPELSNLKDKNNRLFEVTVRYFYDMSVFISKAEQYLKPDGKLILVCGDNYVGGLEIKTWDILNKLANVHGFELFDSFGDEIKRRALAPKRQGHKSIIKSEIVSAFYKK